MSKAMNLRIPGPTPVPPAVLAAMAKPMISHRSEEFSRLLRHTAARVAEVIPTGNSIIILTASGTGGLEAAAANVIRPGDHVLSVCTGYFGERFAAIAQRFSGKVDFLKYAPGQAADAKEVAAAISKQNYNVVLVTHNETSTGVLNDLPAISAALGKGPERPLLIIDGVSSLAATPLLLDDDQYDIAVTASQKAWMTPPGLSMLAVSERTWQAMTVNTTPRYYLDLLLARRSAEKGETPWTPAISLIYALDVALDMILAEGIEAGYERHNELSHLCRKGLRQLGLKMVSAEATASPTVTAAYLPSALSYSAFSRYMSEHYELEVADGQGALKGKAFRVGHMGYVHENDIHYLLSAVADALNNAPRQ